MEVGMALHDVLYRFTSGSERARKLLTPIGLIVFLAVMCGFVWGGIRLDRALGFGRFLPRGPGLAAGGALIVLGVFLSVWSILVFAVKRGTPVPFNPPRELVVKGPYVYARNPMLTGLFMQFFGLGLLLGSVSLTFLVTPAIVVASVVLLKAVEEPELEQRLGEAYVEYRRATPMFLPWLGRAVRDARRRNTR
jgi:protein-S-isoprenylcysteine O-methyltransferase Ste14